MSKQLSCGYFMRIRYRLDFHAMRELHTWNAWLAVLQTHGQQTHSKSHTLLFNAPRWIYLSVRWHPPKTLTWDIWAGNKFRKIDKLTLTQIGALPARWTKMRYIFRTFSQMLACFCLLFITAPACVSASIPPALCESMLSVYRNFSANAALDQKKKYKSSIHCADYSHDHLFSALDRCSCSR